MEKNVKKRMALNGRLKGSALIAGTENGTLVTLSVRGLEDGTILYSAGDGRIEKAVISGGSARTAQKDVCALVLVKDGRTVSEGFSGDCGKNRGRILDEIRIMAAEEPRKRTEPVKKTSDNKPVRETKRVKTPGAPVTEGILRQAERLFSALGNTGFEAPARGEADEGRVIPNPFPRTFPGVEWRVMDGDHRLFGTRIDNGVRSGFIAVPIDMRRRVTIPRGRVIVSIDGRRFLVEQIL